MSKNINKKKVLIFTGHYLPGTKSGGPVQTIYNLTQAYTDYADFFIVCKDRDINDDDQYTAVKVNEWNCAFGANIYYCSIDKITRAEIKKLCDGFDIVFCCGTYDRYSIILSSLARHRLIQNLIIAPMGNLNRNALNLKSRKKKIFWFIAKIFKLHKNVKWSFSTKNEYSEAINILGNKINYMISSDIPRHPVDCTRVANEKLRVVFLSRISRIKNLIQTINVLTKVKAPIVFDIYGPIEDQEYWAECQKQLKLMPKNIEWTYFGSVEPNNVQKTFSKYDIFLFLTLGENFGHAIFESISSGCLPIISKYTPWTDSKVVDVFDLDNTELISQKIDFYNLHRDELLKNQKHCIDYAKDKYKKIVTENEFLTLLIE